MSCLFQTPRTYNAANFEDLSEVVRHVKILNPGIPLAAAGISMGGYVILYSKCYYLYIAFPSLMFVRG